MVSVRGSLASSWVRHGLVLFVAAGIIVLSVISGVESMNHHKSLAAYCRQPDVICINTGPFGVLGADKWIHGVAYALLTATLAYAYVAPVRTDRRTRLAQSVCLVVVFGVCLEFVQWPIPHRTMSGLDAIANTVGACLLAAIWWWRKSTVRPGGGEAVSN